jgi:SNF2 family DNA or RNA helicase
LIERKNNDNRKIVFCHFHKEIDEIEKRCLGAGMTVKKIDGRLASREKSQAMIAPWPEVMILQINTCCEGLNLQDFNEIYFASPHWNPAVEDQAIARCHRIGQKKDVYVFRFNMISLNDSCNSQDNYCVEVQERKRKLYVY